MRKAHSVQSDIFERLAEHEIARKLKGPSEWLDAHPPGSDSGVGVTLRAT